MDMVTPVDMDMSDPPDDGPCVPESNQALCVAAGAECGMLPSTLDSCGTRRTPMCGDCPGDGNACVDNKCSCEAESDEDLCTAAQAVCGEITVTDTCGVERTVTCGSCIGDGEECDNNRCLVPCGDETSAELCMGAGAQCGSISLVNSCGDQVTINCGMCLGQGEDCAPNNVCFCVPESDDDLCDSSGAECGDTMVEDRCGNTRMINCGGCPGADDFCNATNQCECTPETDGAFCGRNSAQCGTISAPDNCGMMRMVNCGGCNDGICEADNTCSVCQPETDEQFCARINKTCGDVTGMDNCGDPRTANCGSCSNDRTCSGNNTCECPAPSCSGVECGSITNACNRTSDCGGCGNNEVCSSNTCVCDPETDAELCTAANATCGSITTQDRCGATRTVNCGTCSGGQVCENGGNTCCSSESNNDFCMNANAECGNISGTDNCGYPRSINCGGCGMGESCNNNQCECVPETDAQICALESASCGTVTRTDRCGVMRTVNCGPNNGMCGADETCTAGVCVCDQIMCGAQCGTVSNACGNSTDCGGCGTDESCSNNACVCDTPVCDPSFECGSVMNACNNVTRCGPLNGDCDKSNGNDNAVCNTGTNMCDCQPFDDNDICRANGDAECGSVTASNGCGMMVTVDCGMCDTSNGQDNNTCSNNKCSCTPDSDAAICQANGDPECGPVTDNDGCGMMVTVDCGMCDTSNGFDNNMCVNGACSCTPLTDQEICDAYGMANGGEACGNIGMQSDGCGNTSNVNCGNSCTAGVCTNNICTL